MDQNQERRRGHFHRGRRGPDRRNIDRRTQPQQPPPGARDQVDVEQIMRDIRSRIAQRQGIELTNQQIQDLAARRLESILDPRAIKPSLLEGLRRSAGAPPASAAPRASTEPVYTFEDFTIYDSPRASLRFIRRMLAPLLKLFFNPNPLIRALHLQARLNVEAAEREVERDRRQSEWNALHYEILQRVVTDVSRVSLEVQALALKVESLNGRVDFNDRRVRSMEGAAPAPRATARPAEVVPQATAEGAASPEGADTGGAATEGGRRRRRRRRGRRGAGMQGEHVAPTSSSLQGSAPPPMADGSDDEEPDVETPPHEAATHEVAVSSEVVVSSAAEPFTSPEPAESAATATPPAPSVPVDHPPSPLPTPDIAEPTDPDRSEP